MVSPSFLGSPFAHAAFFICDALFFAALLPVLRAVLYFPLRPLLSCTPPPSSHISRSFCAIIHFSWCPPPSAPSSHLHAAFRTALPSSILTIRHILSSLSKIITCMKLPHCHNTLVNCAFAFAYLEVYKWVEYSATYKVQHIKHLQKRQLLRDRT
jgi:hypothetical protein